MSPDIVCEPNVAVYADDIASVNTALYISLHMMHCSISTTGVAALCSAGVCKTAGCSSCSALTCLLFCSGAVDKRAVFL